MKRNIVLIIMVLGMLAFSGCSVQKNQEEKPLDEETMKKFDQVVSGEYDEQTILDFADENRDKLSQQSMSRVLLKLESTQRDLQEKRMNELFQSDIQKRLNEQAGGELIKSPSAVQDQDLKELVQRMKDRGYVLMSLEGSYYQIIDYQIYKKYSGAATKDIGAYIDIMAAEYGEFAMVDAHPAIPMDAVFARIMNAESFLDSYPDSEKFEEMKNLYSYYVGIYLYGTAFDPQTNELSDEARRSYEKAATANEQSNFISLFNGYYEVLQGEGYKLTQQVDSRREQVQDGLLDKYEQK